MRRSILHTALELVMRQGVEKLSLRAVARQLDYSPAALYEYFPSKEALVAALQGEVDRQLSEMLRDSTPSAEQPISHAENLVRAGKACLHFASQNPQLFALLPPSAPNAVRQVFLETLQAGAADGQFIQDPALGTEDIAHAWWALVYGLAAVEMADPGRADDILHWFVVRFSNESRFPNNV
jgi:AcrR family transcriptional regulator